MREAYRDLGLTAVIAPSSHVAAAAAYAVIYPWLIDRAGPQVLGLWSLFSVAPLLLGSASAGFAQHLTRLAGLDQSPAILHEAALDQAAARRAYWIMTAVLALTVLLTGPTLFRPLADIYPVASLVGVSVVLVIGVGASQVADLEGAVLSAHHDHYWVSLIRGIAPFLVHGLAVAGVLAGYPLEGIAAGWLAAGLFRLLTLRHRLRLRYGWSKRGAPLGWRETVRRLKALTRRTLHLYAVSLGLTLRDVMLRYLLAAVVGLAAAGIFDIAMRVTSVCRNLVAAAVASLFPAFARTFRQRDRATAIDLARTGMALLLIFGGAALGLLAGAAETLYGLWLGSLPDGLGDITRWLAAWMFTTLITMPFTLMLLSSHHEKAVAALVWGHLVSTVLVVPAGQALALTMTQVVAFWSAAGITINVAVLVVAHARLRLVGPVLLERGLLALMLLAGAAFGTCVVLGSAGAAPAWPLAVAGGYGLAALALSAGRLRRTLRPLRESATG